MKKSVLLHFFSFWLLLRYLLIASILVLFCTSIHPQVQRVQTELESDFLDENIDFEKLSKELDFQITPLSWQKKVALFYQYTQWKRRAASEMVLSKVQALKDHLKENKAIYNHLFVLLMFAFAGQD